MTAAEQEANDDTHRCDDPLDTDQFTNIMNIYESGHISYDSEEDEDEETSISGHDDTEKDVEVITFVDYSYDSLPIYSILSAVAEEDTDCTSVGESDSNPLNEVTCWQWVSTHGVIEILL